MESTATSEPLVINFDAKALAPVALFKPTNDIRYYLNGIAVLKHPVQGCIVCATNGHHLAAWYDKNGACSKDTILNVSGALVAASRKKKDAGMYMYDRRVYFSDGRLVLDYFDSDGTALGRETFVQPRTDLIIDGVYPKIAKVLPDPNNLVPGLFGSYSNLLMENIVKAGKLISQEKGRVVGITHYTDKKSEVRSVYGDAILTRFDGYDHFIVLLMPRVCGVIRSPLPDSFVDLRSEYFKNNGA